MGIYILNVLVLNLLLSCGCVAAERRRLLSVDISSLHGAQQQTRRRPTLLSIDGTDVACSNIPFNTEFAQKGVIHGRTHIGANGVS